MPNNEVIVNRKPNGKLSVMSATSCPQHTDYF